MHEVILKPDKRYSVGKIVCIGQNYPKHNKEMNSSYPESPILFLKPSTAIIHEGSSIILPEYSKEVHHEVELALLVSKLAKNIPARDWREFIAGAGIALDLTLRDHQRKAKDGGLPWSVSKGFDRSCPVSEFVPIKDISDIQNLGLELEVNGEIRQAGSTSEMIFKVDQLISFISRIFTLEPGDLVLTGTPAGVSKLNHGDMLNAKIDKIGSVSFNVA